MEQIYSFRQIPEFENKHEETEFWKTHELSDELLEAMEGKKKKSRKKSDNKDNSGPETWGDDALGF